MLYLGVDSGGTKAAFLLTDETGRVYARHREPGCTALGSRKAGMKQMLETGIAAICQKANIQKEDITALGLGICGYGEGEGAAEETQEACAEAFIPGRFVCGLDTYIGWAGSLLFEPGINVIAGTGSAVFGVAADGRPARAGGWGAGCDEGSCTWLGQRLVEAFTRQADGRMPRTQLYEI
jgi:N-acetylglucosamine kinase-like BadF-type ATPase